MSAADHQIQSLWHDWDFLWGQYSSTVATGNRAPTLGQPTDLGNWDKRSFYLDYTSDNSTDLDELSYVEWRSDYRQGTATNQTPTFFIIQPDNNVIVESPADQSYTITADYWKAPTKLVANADISAIPIMYHRIIVTRAKTMWAEREEAPEILLASSAEYQDLLDKLESQSLPGQRARRFGIVDTDEVIRPI